MHEIAHEYLSKEMANNGHILVLLRDVCDVYYEYLFCQHILL